MKKFYMVHILPFTVMFRLLKIENRMNMLLVGFQKEGSNVVYELIQFIPFCPNILFFIVKISRLYFESLTLMALNSL